MPLNADKTEFMSFNQAQETVLKSANNENIKKVDNFIYLGASIDNKVNDVKVKKALAWKSCNKLNKNWQSSLSKPLKLHTFLALIEFDVFLYGSETWTLTKSLEKSIDGTYTMLLRMAYDVSWSEHLTNSELYGNLLKISEKIRPRRPKLSGHCVRHPEEIASALILWQPSQGRPNRRRKRTTYVDNIMKDTNMERVEELRSYMLDRDTWREVLKNYCGGLGWNPT